MRRYFWPIIALVLLAVTSCQQTVNIEEEKEAIMAVLQEESAAVMENDKERLFANHVQDSLETRLELGEFGYNVVTGWDEIKNMLGDFIEGAGVVEGAVNSKENVVIKVKGDCAWVTCDNIWKWGTEDAPGGFDNIQITFLEKIHGDWKISFAAYYTKPLAMMKGEVAPDETAE